jgi:hypothetical protein
LTDLNSTASEQPGNSAATAAKPVMLRIIASPWRTSRAGWKMGGSATMRDQDQRNDERILYFIAAVVENVELIPLTCKS